jgi:HEAT repeat protein
MRTKGVIFLFALAAATGGTASSDEVSVPGPAATSGRVELEACLDDLGSPSAEIRLRAVQELSGLGLDGALREEALFALSLARHDRDLSVVLQAELALASLSGEDPEPIRAAYGVVKPDPRQLVSEALGASDPEVRKKAVVALGRWYRGSEIETLLAATRDDDAAVRLQAVEQLGEIEERVDFDDAIAEALARASTDRDPAVREMAIFLLESLR